MKGFWRLMRYIRNYWTNVWLNIVSNIFMAFFTVVSIPAIIPFLQILFERSPAVSKPTDFSWNADSIVQNIRFQVFTLIEESGRETALFWICLGIIVLFFLKNVFRYLSLFFMAPVRNGIIQDLRQQLFQKVLYQDLGFFSNTRKGDLISRVSTDVQEIEWSILNALEAIFREPLIIAGCLVFMIYVSPPLTIFVFVLLLFTIFIIGGIGRTLKHSSAKVQDRLGNLISILEETLSGLRIIKGFNAEKVMDNRFWEENRSYKYILTRLLWRRDLSSPLSEFLGVTVVAVLLWYGSSLVFSRNLEAETFFAFLFAFFNLLDPAKKFATAYYNVQKGLAAIDRVEKILYAEPQIIDAPDAIAKTSFEKNITFKDVFFTYGEQSDWVLQQINLTINRGKKIALVGSSGAGKSTLVDLLPRFYDVQKGQISIDGIPIKSLRLNDLRALMGIVSQEPILFNDTIYNNIVFGTKGATKEAVEKAAKIAYAHDFILDAPEGYQTKIGDRGVKLSGGQRQRLTIARAVLNNPPILILDEATSALDSESEKYVQLALENVLTDRTAIIIAHRLSTVQHADEIIVLKDGLIVERGSHDDLMKKDTDYRKMVTFQDL